MGAYKQITSTFRNEYKERGDIVKARLVGWRAESPIIRITRPTNLPRARELGYKAKQGVIMARVKVLKGLSKREKPAKGRKPSKNGRFFAMSKSLQAIAEERAARKFINCEVVNSYYVGEDGTHKFFEAILVDKEHPAVLRDRLYGDVVSRKSRAFRGLTHAGREHRDSIQKG
ncbi:MAG: 50S ribosomal protein L15e [Candidatus Micrarchaeaceae archaeon]